MEPITMGSSRTLRQTMYGRPLRLRGLAGYKMFDISAVAIRIARWEKGERQVVVRRLHGLAGPFPMRALGARAENSSASRRSAPAHTVAKLAKWTFKQQSRKVEVLEADGEMREALLPT